MVPAEHERVRRGLWREEDRLRGAKFLVVSMISEVDYDRLTEQVGIVTSFSTPSEAGTFARDQLHRELDGDVGWKETRLPHQPLEVQFLYGRGLGDGGFNSVNVRIWIFTCTPTPLLQLLEAWLPFKDELVTWLGRK